MDDAVDAEEHAHLALLGIEVDVGCALLDRLGDEGVHKADRRRLRLAAVVAAERLERLLGLVDPLDGLVEALLACEQRADVVERGDGRLHLQAGHHRDVVDRQQVARVGHREQQAAVLEVLDRDGLVAAGHLDLDEPDGAHVDRIDGQVDVVEPEALGEHARKLVIREHAGLDEHLPGALALGARLLDRGIDARLLGEPELDRDVADHVRRARAQTRAREAG